MQIMDMNGNDITNPDLTKGKLVWEEVLVRHHEAVEAVEEQWHHKVIAQYDNGGVDVEKVIEVPGVAAQAAWDEYETVQRYIPYTEDELAQIENEKNSPKPLTVEERLIALEKTVTPAKYAAGTWYYRGDYVIFEAEVYSCVAPMGVVCVWSPAEYGAYWQKRV